MLATTGAGCKRCGVTVVGSAVSSAILTLAAIPAIYALVKQ